MEAGIERCAYGLFSTKQAESSSTSNKYVKVAEQLHSLVCAPQAPPRERPIDRSLSLSETVLAEP